MSGSQRLWPRLAQSARRRIEALRERTIQAALKLERLCERARQRLLITPEPSLERTVSQLCAQRQCESPVFHSWCSTMRAHLRTDIPDIRYSRKIWEWVYILQALDANQLVAPGRRGWDSVSGVSH